MSGCCEFWFERWAEEASDGGDGAAAGGAAPDFQREREGKWRVFRHVRGQRPVQSHINRRSKEQGAADGRDATEGEDRDDPTADRRRVHGGR